MFVGAGLALFFMPAAWLPSYYKPIPMGIVAIGYSFLITLPTWVFRPSRERDWFQIALALDLLLCGLGSLGFWNISIIGMFGYDKLIHFTFSASMMVTATYLLSSHNRWSMKKTVFIVALLIAVSGVAWEYIEYFFAAYFHFGYFGTLFDYDSRHDILANILGVMAGLIVIRFRTKRRDLYINVITKTP